MKKAVLNVFVKMLTPGDIESLREDFEKIDTDNSGFIELAELQKALSNG